MKIYRYIYIYITAILNFFFVKLLISPAVAMGTPRRYLTAVKQCSR